ncbi:MAG: serine hydrolase, partial [Candidatus Levyibacteriota bacterium]
SPVNQISLASYPELSSKLDLDITAQAAVVIDDQSKAVLYAKNENLRFSMASTTKIMTALVAMDYFKPDDILTVYKGDVEPVVVGFSLGERVHFMDVLYGMLLPSGNDAAIMIAQNYPGGEEAFIAKMNEKAKNFNLINTHFEDSSGFSDDNYSTPLEMARFASLALQNKTLAGIVATKSKTITDVSGANIYYLSNLDVLLDKEGITGVKTGYTEEAGGVLITSSEANGKRLILVVMKSKDRFADIEKILSQIEGSVTFVSNHP